MSHEGAARVRHFQSAKQLIGHTTKEIDDILKTIAVDTPLRQPNPNNKPNFNPKPLILSSRLLPQH